MPGRGATPLTLTPPPLKPAGSPLGATVRMGARRLPLIGLALMAGVAIYDWHTYASKRKFRTPTGWVFRSYGALNYGGGIPADLVEDAVTGDAAVGGTRWASNTYDPLNYRAGPQPAYFAAIGNQVVAGNPQWNYRGLWLRTNEFLRYEHVASYFLQGSTPRPFTLSYEGGVLPNLSPAPSFWVNLWPLAMPVTAWGYVPTPAPIRTPITRPEPSTPEQPDVGPRPAPRPLPRPNPGPGLNPLPEIPLPPELPGLMPGVSFPPAVQPVGRVELRPNSRPRQNPRINPRARRSPRNTRETKARMGRVLGFLWAATGQLTEYIDVIDIGYEALPQRIKVDEYMARGRQPNPAERAEILYRYLDQMDTEKFINELVKNNLEDSIYALGGTQLGQAARNADRPIGFEAGGGLTGGGGEPVPTEGGPPDWWPDFLPWGK